MDDAGLNNAIRGVIKVKVLMVGPVEEVGGVATHTKYLVKELQKAGIDVEIYSTSPKGDCPFFMANFIKLYKKTLGLIMKLLTSKEFEIVHLQVSGPIGGFLPALVASLIKKSDIKLVISFHYRPDPDFIRKNRNIFQLVLSRADAFFVVSSKQKKNIKKILGSKFLSKLYITSNGFSPSFYPTDKSLAREQLALPPDKKILLNVGSLVPVKGQKYLLEAMKIVSEKRNDVICVIVGDGPLEAELKKKIKKEGLEGKVILVGAKPHDEIPLWMNAADLFVLSSLSEGNPTVMFEALGVGLPFVGTKVGGVPEIITSEDYGLLCEPANPKELAEKILIALEKEWDREKIRKYAEQFTWENIAKRTLEIYGGVLGESEKN